MSRSRLLLEHQTGALNRALGMRFAREVGAGTISDQAYANYLHIESDFVRTAARLHGFAAWAAPSWASVRHNGLALHALVTEQTDYFQAARAAWPVPARLADAAGPRAEELTDFTLSAARSGGYPAIMTVLFAAETLYLAWCTRAQQAGSVPPGPLRDWVAMHAAAPFRAGVDALAEQVDLIPPEVPNSQLDIWFSGMLDAEITFHDAVFEQPA